MNESVTAPPATSPRSLQAEVLATAMVVLAAFNIALAIFMAVAPHAFYKAIGPFGASNDHYVRDVATFYGAVGAGFAIAVRRVSWRVPLLAITMIQFALHSVNHLVDIGDAHPAWTGYFDFFSLAATTLLLAWLLALALEQARTSQPDQEGARR
jgi:hypothetical protein